MSFQSLLPDNALSCLNSSQWHQGEDWSKWDHIHLIKAPQMLKAMVLLIPYIFITEMNGL